MVISLSVFLVNAFYNFFFEIDLCMLVFEFSFFFYLDFPWSSSEGKDWTNKSKEGWIHSTYIVVQKPVCARMEWIKSFDLAKHLFTLWTYSNLKWSLKKGLISFTCGNKVFWATISYKYHGCIGKENKTFASKSSWISGQSRTG